MLTQLTVSNYAIAERVELQFGKGMTALTGETGAGKSTMIKLLTSIYDIVNGWIGIDGNDIKKIKKAIDKYYKIKYYKL